jgi:hypothetical protein
MRWLIDCDVLIEGERGNPALPHWLAAADEATEVQKFEGALASAQCAPASVERKSGPNSTAPSTVPPSEEQATAYQLVAGDPVCVQVWPESVDS